MYLPPPSRILIEMADPPDIFSKQYMLTAGPTPLPPSVSAGDGASRSSTTGRPPSSRSTPGSWSACRWSSRPATTSSASPPRGPARWSRRSPTWWSPASPPWSPRAASSASAGPSSATPTAPTPSHLEFEWGEKVDPARLDEALAGLGRPPRAVFVTQSETSTGVVNDIRALNEVATAHGSVLCVDAVSGLGAVDLPQDEWGVDVVVSGSQKSLMCPPGLGFRLGLRAGAGARRREPRPPLLLRLGAHRRGPAGGAAELGRSPRR